MFSRIKFCTALVSIALATSAFSATAFAADAPGGSGGGNVMVENLAGPWVIQDWLGRAKEPTRYALHQFEMILAMLAKDKTAPAMPNVDYSVLYKKLFGGSKTIYQALDEAVFAPVPSGGCAGIGTPLETDANSLKNPPNICFSLENLAKKFGESSGKPQLIALVAHEVSHMVGATEDEAQQIQMTIQSAVFPPALDNSAQLGKEFRQRLADLILVAKDNLSLRVSSSSYCQAITMMGGELGDVANSVSENMPTLGVMVPSPKGTGELSGALFKVLNLVGACAPPGSNDDHSPTGTFGATNKGVNQVTVNQFAVALGFTAWDGYPNINIRRVSPKDSKTIRLELQDILQLLQDTQKESTQVSNGP